jgi:hypothetical protein
MYNLVKPMTNMVFTNFTTNEGNHIRNGRFAAYELRGDRKRGL